MRPKVETVRQLRAVDPAIWRVSVQACAHVGDHPILIDVPDAREMANMLNAAADIAEYRNKTGWGVQKQEAEE